MTPVAIMAESSKELEDNIIIENAYKESPEWENRKRYNIDQLTSKGMDDLLKLKEKLLKSGV